VNRNLRSRGAILVELALGLPLFLGTILFIVWLAISVNAHASLDLAVKNAVRAGLTRGILRDQDQIGFIESANPGNRGDPSFNKMMNYNSGKSDSDAIAYYNEHTFLNQYLSVYNTNNRSIETAYPEYIYTLIYLNEALKGSLGGNVKFPCNPGPDATNNPGTAECVECQFLDPVCHDFRGSPAAPSACTGPPPNPGSLDLPRGRIGLSCRYHFNSTILAPVLALLNMVAPSITSKLSIVEAKSIHSETSIPITR
jgi:hypothetical protein